MPWTSTRYPPAMRRLPPVLREKAIEIANAMLADGVDEGRAIRMAIAAARRWGARRVAWNGSAPPPWIVFEPPPARLRRGRPRWP